MCNINVQMCVNVMAFVITKGYSYKGYLSYPVHVDMAEPSHGSRIQKNPLARVCRRFVMSKRCATVQINDKFLFMTSRVRLVLRLVPSAHCKGLPPE